VTEPQRLAELNDAPEMPGDYVLYGMQQSQRADFNPALEIAIAAANRLSLPVLVCFGLTDGYPQANARHYAFMLEGLAETATALRKRGLGFVIRRGSPDDVALDLAARAALIVCDRGYLRPQKHWYAKVAAEAGRRVLQVEGDVVVPVALVSAKAEIGARTLRRKLSRLREDFLTPFRRERLRHRADALDIASDADLGNIPALLASLRIDHRIGPSTYIQGGAMAAGKHLRSFVAQRLTHYVEARALPGVAEISMMSPYLHFGQISPVEIALAVKDATAASDNRASYLEELIVRRELAANFVAHVPDYDRYSCLPDWARRTLAAHQSDPRQHLYAYDRLAACDTHDPYWNAAMREMVVTGFMHNYMRMYWGKKVLEWSPTPEEGYATLLRLNNTYFIDGRDMNSYAGVGWVFGLHDRPWPQRPIFGAVRSMMASGLKRKTDIDAYVARIGLLT
jgi:deoxyribodipyrimidine photo-lyase